MQDKYINSFTGEEISGKLLETIGNYKVFKRDVYENVSNGNLELTGVSFDIVLNNTCISMYAGINGAKNRIAELQETTEI